MKIAIYSSGPSIARLRFYESAMGDAAPDMRIAINNAINVIPDGASDVYCAGDSFAYRNEYTIRRPSVCWCCMCEEFRKEILGMGNGWERLPSKIWSDLPALAFVSSPSYSITSAIALAAHLGANKIDVFGHDASVGRFNSGGEAHGSIYSSERSVKEAREISEVVSHLHSVGITVTIRSP